MVLDVVIQVHFFVAIVAGVVFETCRRWQRNRRLNVTVRIREFFIGLDFLKTNQTSKLDEKRSLVVDGHYLPSPTLTVTNLNCIHCVPHSNCPPKSHPNNFCTYEDCCWSNWCSHPNGQGVCQYCTIRQSVDETNSMNTSHTCYYTTGGGRELYGFYSEIDSDGLTKNALIVIKSMQFLSSTQIKRKKSNDFYSLLTQRLGRDRWMSSLHSEMSNVSVPRTFTFCLFVAQKP